MKGQVLHLLRVQLKVPGDSSDLSVLLTKKSLMFLLRLNEMSGGSEKILLVSLHVTHNPLIRSDEGLTLETSAFPFYFMVV